MNRLWTLSILVTAFFLLAILKTYEVNTLSTYFKGEKVLKLRTFSEAREKVSKQDKDLLELWESIITGRSAPLSHAMKESYKALGLNHIFTPSGFHLSAVLFPFMKLIRSRKGQLILISMVGILLAFLPGLGALKRMVLIKGQQNIFGLHLGFCIALTVDILFGTFQNSALSFTYSFLFLGLIYSGAKGLVLVIWFFFGQMLLAYFQGNEISLLLLAFSPFLNLTFAFLMPILFALSWPLMDWQLETGLYVLSLAQSLVDALAKLSTALPTLEVNFFTLLLVSFIVTRKGIWFLVGLLIYCPSLDTSYSKAPGFSKFVYSPQGKVRKTIYRKDDVMIVFQDGKCRMKLVQGFWYESCSPRRRSSKKKKTS